MNRNGRFSIRPWMTLASCAVLLSVAGAQGVSQEARLTAAVHEQSSMALLANPELTRNPYAVLVKFKTSAPASMRTLARTMAGVNSLRQYQLVPGLELVSTNGRSPEAVVASLKSLPGVEYAELDVVMHTTNQRFPEDPTFYPYSWGMHNDGQLLYQGQASAGADVNAPEAWFMTVGDPNFVVAVIDGGVQYTHYHLDENIWTNPGEVAANGIDDDGNGYVDDVRGWDFSANDNDPMDESGHGTHVAGTIGAEQGLRPDRPSGVVGMMWHCQIMPLRVFDANGSGYMSNAALAVQYAVAKGVKVSNNSYGYGTNSIAQSLYDAIQASAASNHIFVAAAGNNARSLDGNKMFYPACFDLDNIISVAATTMNDGLTSFSNYGASRVDLGAPGQDILSTYLLDWGGPGYNQAWLSGTSMATPHVVGAVGLVYVQNPTWSWQQVKNRIMSTARPIAALAGKTVTGGVLDAGAALGNAAPPPPAPPAAPGMPTVTRLSGLNISISWADNSNNEDDFLVQRETKSGNKWINLISLPAVGANSTSTTDTVPALGTYRYRVQARNSVGTSTWTSWVQIKL